MTSATAELVIDTDTQHPFEKSGLGVAPFSYAGMTERVITYPGGVTQPSGTCDYCGMGIKYCFGVESSDRRRFEVGSECIFKLNRADNATTKIITAVAAEVKRIESARRKAVADAKKKKELARIQAAYRLLQSKPSILASVPHPTPERAARGETMGDYCRWMFSNAGRSGMLRVAKIVEDAAANS